MIRVRGLLRRQRRRLVVLAALVALFVAVVAAHSNVGEGHMGDDGVGEAVSICLAVLQLGLGLTVAGVALRALPRRQPAHRTPRPGLALAGPGQVTSIRPRAGPSLLQVFLR